MNRQHQEESLVRVLEEAAQKLEAVKGAIWSSYDSGADVAAFVRGCVQAIEGESLSQEQKRELWGIFAPTCDWDDIVGDCALGNRVFGLVDDLYRHEF